VDAGIRLEPTVRLLRRLSDHSPCVGDPPGLIRENVDSSLATPFDAHVSAGGHRVIEWQVKRQDFVGWASAILRRPRQTRGRGSAQARPTWVA
jgi:hypothetical protein